jgi:8-oxo-dGTP pyrophosphatase MutT (NUDIX family)
MVAAACNGTHYSLDNNDSDDNDVKRPHGTSSTMLAPRVWVHSNPCVFGQSIFDTILAGNTNKDATRACRHYDRTLVSLKQPGGNGGVPHLDATGTQELGGRLPMGRARAYPKLQSTPCPTTVIVSSDTPPPPNNKLFAQLAVVGLVLDDYGRLLVTRRPSYMRSFPSAWVLPGGGVQATDDSLEAALSREVQEETGLSIDESNWKYASLWESVYPTTILPGSTTHNIQAHHLCLYMIGEADHISKLELCEKEVDAAVWLEPVMVQNILQATHDYTAAARRKMKAQVTTIRSIRNDRLEREMIHYQDLVGIYPQRGQRPEELCGIAQGSLFAMEEAFNFIMD